VFAAFPTAIVEDAAFTPETRPLVEPQADRLSFDYPIDGVESLESLPVEPGWCNVKPSRFGTLESLFETITYCEERGIELYGGGQFELASGRTAIQTLAALFYPDAPNDVAPREFNDPEASPPYPMSPLGPDATPSASSSRWEKPIYVGLRYRSRFGSEFVGSDTVFKWI